MIRKYMLIGAVLVSLISNSGFANTPRSIEHHPVSRYVTINPEATYSQKNPLKGVVENVNFHRGIKNVGSAIRELLKASGYRLAPHHPDNRIYRMFSLQLPEIHRRMGPITLENALKVLAGEPWMLSVDPINRFISFELPGLYKVPANRVTPKKYSHNSNKQKKPIAKRHVKKVVKKTTKQQTNIKKVVKKNEKKIFNLTWSDLPEEWKK